MTQSAFKKLALLAGFFLLLWLGGRFLLPLILPFLLGALLAAAAEPSVRRLSGKLPRGLAAGIGVGGTLILLIAVILTLTAILLRQLSRLAQILPDIENMAMQGMQTTEDFLLSLANHAPDTLRSLLVKMILDLFHNDGGLAGHLTLKIPPLISGIISHIPGSALSVGTGVFSAFLISARMPMLKAWIQKRFLSKWKLLPAFHSLQVSLGGWLRAQVMLAFATFLILTAGLLLLRIPYAPIWAAGIALLDAFPLLGTGIILVPWALIQLLQGSTFTGIGLLITFAAASLTRSLLEPKLVGKQLGLDPLLTLFALYAGYRLWGFFGMLMAPIAVVAVMQFTENGTSSQEKSQ